MTDLETINNAALREQLEQYKWLRDLKCSSVTVGHNDENAPNYMTASNWIEDKSCSSEFDDVPVEEIALMRELNSIWTIQIYPNTPVGFNKYYGATLEAAIRAAMKGESRE